MLGLPGELRADAAAGKYRIVSQLGQGGTADVFLAVADGPSGFQKLVVLKVLKKSLSSDDEFRAMFLSEARLAARLHHPHIVQTNEVLELDGTPIMVMEYLEGQPLSQVIVRGRQGGFTLAMQLRVLVEALGGLHGAHELTDFDGSPLGVVHRDVSPHNLFVTLEGHAKVLDFGIAKLERSIVETEVGTVKGKLRYMAPEQIAGEKLDRRADIYAAGVILWEALVGERMWKGCSEREIRTRVLAGDLPTPQSLRPDLPPALDRICRRALALLPVDRYPTALDFADDLEGALPGLGGEVSHREIGAAVARLFEDVRAETRDAIERKLRRLSIVPEPAAADGSGEVSAARSPDQTNPGVGREVAAGRAVSPEVSLDRPAGPGASGRRWRGRILVALSGVVVIAGLALGVWRSGLLSAARRSGLSAPPAAPSTQAAAVAPRVIGHDGQPTPGPTAAPADGARRAVEFGRADPRAGRATGGPAGKGSPRRPPLAVPDPTTTSTTPPAPARDCEHPFFVDVDGIKKFRPECM